MHEAIYQYIATYINIHTVNIIIYINSKIDDLKTVSAVYHRGNCNQLAPGTKELNCV